MATEPVHQPVQHRRLRLDVDVRRREPGPAQPSNQTSANLPNGLIVLIQDLSRLVVARRLGDERDSDLHLQSSFGIEGPLRRRRERACDAQVGDVVKQLVIPHKSEVVLAEGDPYCTRHTRL